MRNIIYILFGGLFILSSCQSGSESIELFNERAKLPETFKFDTLGLKVMSSFFNKKSGTMSTLYANPFALSNALDGDKSHRAGEVFALVTWKQKADGNYFGADIPGDLQSVEIIKSAIAAKNAPVSYKKYTGKNLDPAPDIPHQKERITYIFSQRPSVMP
jgi:hypothetical protein